MKGSEKQVLRIVKELGEADCEAMARKIGVSTEHVAEICLGLVKDAYLMESSKGSYRLAPQALKALSPIKTRGPIAILKGGG